MINKKAGLVLVLVFMAISIGVLLFSPREKKYEGGDITGAIVVANGRVIDKNFGVADNFKNGKTVVEITITHDDFDEVLDEERSPLKITILGREAWSVPTINLRDNSGKTENNYGENIECDGVVLGPDNSKDNLYVKLSVPTTSGGDVVVDMSIIIELWPTDDSVEAIDGNISPASFDNETTYDWWDENDIIALDLLGRNDAARLVGLDGARLLREEIDD